MLVAGLLYRVSDRESKCFGHGGRKSEALLIKGKAIRSPGRFACRFFRRPFVAFTPTIPIPVLCALCPLTVLTGRLDCCLVGWVGAWVDLMVMWLVLVAFV